MAELDYTKIDQPYNEYASRHVLPVLPGNPSDFDPNSGEDVVETGQSLENLTISTWIKSRNYQPNKQGFMLDGQRGNFYGNNVFLIGTINALLGKIGSNDNYWNIGANGITAVSGTGDVIINYGKTDFGQDAIDGFIIGYDFSASLPKMEMGSSISNLFKFDGTNVTLTGTVNALSGKIGSTNNYWSIGSSGITAVASTGDVIINYGKTDFGQDAVNGFILGYDFSASVPKIEMGNSVSKLFKYDGVDFTLIGGTITSGVVRTSSGNPRVEINGTNNRIDVYNSAGTNIAWFGGVGTQGNVLYINQTNTSDDFPPVYITCANTSNVLNLFNTNSSIVNRPGFRFESNNTVSETMYVKNTGAFISGSFESNSTVDTKPTIFSNNTAGGWCWQGVGHMLLNGDYNFYLRYNNTYLHVNTSGELLWTNASGDNYVAISDGSTGAPAAAAGYINVLINGIYRKLLYTS